MLNLVAASACFLLIHFGVSGTRLRDTLVLRLGEGPYRGAFALASVILFGSLLLLALGGTVAIDAKRRRKFGDGWTQFAQTTSSVPFAAILSGRNRIGSALSEIGIVRPLVAALAYALIFYFHGRFFGAPLV